MQESLQTAKNHEDVQESKRGIQFLESSTVISGGYSLARGCVSSSLVAVGTPWMVGVPNTANCWL